MFTVSYISLGTAKARNGAEKLKEFSDMNLNQIPVSSQISVHSVSLIVYPTHSTVPIFYPWVFVLFLILFGFVFFFQLVCLGFSVFIPFSKACSFWHNEWKNQDIALELLEAKKFRIVLYCLSCPFVVSRVCLGRAVAIDIWVRVVIVLGDQQSIVFINLSVSREERCALALPSWTESRVRLLTKIVHLQRVGVVLLDSCSRTKCCN